MCWLPLTAFYEPHIVHGLLDINDGINRSGRGGICIDTPLIWIWRYLLYISQRDSLVFLLFRLNWERVYGLATVLTAGRVGWGLVMYLSCCLYGTEAEVMMVYSYQFQLSLHHLHLSPECPLTHWNVRWPLIRRVLGSVPWLVPQ